MMNRYPRVDSGLSGPWMSMYKSWSGEGNFDLNLPVKSYNFGRVALHLLQTWHKIKEADSFNTSPIFTPDCIILFKALPPMWLKRQWASSQLSIEIELFLDKWTTIVGCSSDVVSYVLFLGFFFMNWSVPAGISFIVVKYLFTYDHHDDFLATGKTNVNDVVSGANK